MDSVQPKVVATLSIPRVVALRLSAGRLLEWTTAQMMTMANQLGLRGVRVVDVKSFEAEPGDRVYAQHFDFYAFPRQPMLPPTPDVAAPDKFAVN